MSFGVYKISAVIVAMLIETPETTAFSIGLVNTASGTNPNDQFDPSFQSELVVPVQRLSAEYEVARPRQSTHPAIQQRFIFSSLAHKSPISKLP
jgi:hypothetical protein